MARAAPKTQRDFKHTWFVREWMATVGFQQQADLIKRLDWSKAKAHAVWHGQRYTQALIDEIAPLVHARPFELLMHPKEAMAIRGFREQAVRLAAVAAEPDAGRAVG